MHTHLHTPNYVKSTLTGLVVPQLDLSLQKVKIIKLFIISECLHAWFYSCAVIKVWIIAWVTLAFFFLDALLPLAERCTHWRVQLSWAWPVWGSVAFHNKIYETHRDECHLLHRRYLRFHLSRRQGGHSLHPSISAVIYTQMEVYVRMGDWWGGNYQWWCQAWIGGEEGLCYYYAGGPPRPVFLRRVTARVVIPLRWSTLSSINAPTVMAQNE